MKAHIPALQPGRAVIHSTVAWIKKNQKNKKTETQQSCDSPQVIQPGSCRPGQKPKGPASSPGACALSMVLVLRAESLWTQSTWDEQSPSSRWSVGNGWTEREGPMAWDTSARGHERCSKPQTSPASPTRPPQPPPRAC